MEFDPNQPSQNPDSLTEPVAPSPRQTAPEPVMYSAFPALPPRPQPKKRSGWRIFWTIILVLSILTNGFMLLGLVGLGMAVATQGGGLMRQQDYIEQVLVSGNRSDKIVVIRLEGIIDEPTSRSVRRQIENASNDPAIRALIIRTITPGGMVSSSDQIHRAISRFRRETNKPVIAFMETIAASGGYYTSVACDRIIAEPTVITGSIGVIMRNLVMKELLEEKLGIQPVVIKSGLRKDWPSMYSETTEEQKQYLTDKLIKPAYERFVSLVAEGRKHALSEAEVRALSDGSIFPATEAHEKKLIDALGYMDDAVAMAESLAGISNARVVEYRQPFSLMSFLGAQSKQAGPISIDRDLLHDLTTPKLMYIWELQGN